MVIVYSLHFLLLLLLKLAVNAEGVGVLITVVMGCIHAQNIGEFWLMFVC